MQFEIVALSPAGFPNPRLAKAAQIAGFQGGIALDFLTAEAADLAVAQQIQLGGPFTLTVPDAKRIALLEHAAQRGCDRVILTGPHVALDVDVPALKGFGLSVWVECIDANEAAAAVSAGADGLVIKGQEAGGRAGEETSYILLQRVLDRVSVPVLVRGGISIHSSAAVLAAGAAGVILDWQLALADESNLPESVRGKLARMDGSETSLLAQDAPARYRAYARPGETAYFALKQWEETEGLFKSSSPESLSEWRNRVAEKAASNELLLIGQDGGFAAFLANEYRTVAGICHAIRQSASRQLRVAAKHDIVGEGSLMAASHGTRYSIVQGPMTRVSDTADFALAVAQGGGLPFLALALMRGPQVGKLLAQTKEKLGSLPWGVGMLGFVPKELRDEQLEQVRKINPPFAIIAGGRPDMAKEFEKEGTPTYLHVPSPELLRNFLEQGARRIIFEGRECGGHVGPRSSFVLWDQMIRVILQHLKSDKAGKPGDYHFCFAGGIHDARSAAMVSAIVAPLTERGVRAGVLLGTGYLFTREAVEGGAIAEGFQQEAIACEQTVLVESGVGHATRCADTPFGDLFNNEKRRLLKEGRPKEEIREKLEGLNLGRLRVASKGIERRTGADGKAVYETIDPETQRREGMYMIGQVAALRSAKTTIEQLHADVAGATALLKTRVASIWSSQPDGQAARYQPSDIAVIGLSGVLPQADSVDEYWQNILHRRSAITEIPKSRWDYDIYFNQDRRAKDQIYSKWGGFVNAFPFDPVKFGMPPTSVSSIDPMQLVMLELTRQALEDAGLQDTPFDRETTCCIVGTGGGTGELGLSYGFRSMVPFFVDRAGGTLADSKFLIEHLGSELPQWTEDSFAGLLLNVVSGRIANRFDFGGTNYIVDAACATALAALRQSVTELETGSSNIAVTASADSMQSPFGYLCFAKTQALSPTGTPRTFDDTADGIVISEGYVVAIMKRLEDAVLDGDNIYAVIKAVGSSSDGKDKGLTAPRPIGQMRALERAYRKAGFDPTTVGLIEAHGTGTVVGDRTEAESLLTFFSQKGAPTRSIALGSVKSQIGHTKCTAGYAGLVKAALALQHRVLPATLNVTKPNSRAKLGEGPMYVNTETRPWLRRLDGAPRRAGVSAFGFGGTNFHVVMEEYVPADGFQQEPPALREWPAELFLMRGAKPDDFVKPIQQILTELQAGSEPKLYDLAAAVCWDLGRREGPLTLAFTATSLGEAREKLAAALPVVQAGTDHKDPKGLYFGTRPFDGKVAFLFPGQGSQSTNMLRDLAISFPAVRQRLEEADAALGLQLGRPLSSFVFPIPVFSAEEGARNEQELKATHVAQPALGAADLAMHALLERLGIYPDMAAGHSYGEFAALSAAGAIALPDLIRISELRGRVIVESAQGELGVMAAVDANESQTAEAIAGLTGVWIANLNAPKQTVLSGTAQGVETALAKLKEKGIAGKLIPVACAFHSPLVAGATQPLAAALESLTLSAPRFPVYSNTTTQPHGSDLNVLRQTLADHLAQPVRFVEEITAMHDAGARLFVECGPARVLSGLASRILDGRDATFIALDQAGKNGLVTLTQALAQIAAAGVRFHAAPLFEGRVQQKLPLAKLLAAAKPQPLSPTTWIIADARTYPAAEFLKLQTNGRTHGNTATRHDSTRKLVLPPAPPTPPALPALPAAAPALAAAPPALPPAPAAVAPAPVLAAAPPAVTTTSVSRPVEVRMSQPNPLTPTPALSAVEPAAPLTGNALEQAIQGHHRLMSRFLDTHRNVMMSFMRQGGSMAAIPASPMPAMTAAPAITAVAAPPTFAAPPVAVAPVASAPVASAPVASAPVASAPVAAAPAVAPTRPAPPPPVAAAAPVAVAAPVPTPAPVAVSAPAPTRVSKADITEKMVGLVSQRTGYPPEMLGLDLDLEADLGVDSIKRVEIFGALQNENILPASAVEGEIETLSKFKTLGQIIDWVDSKVAELTGAPSPAPAVAAQAPAIPAPVAPVAPAPAIVAAPAPAATAVTKEQITEKMVGLVSQRTGYPPEMLGLDLDLEADLGVDSIKRVEIFGALQNENILPASAVEGEIETLSKFKTLGQIIDWVDSKAKELAGSAPVPLPAATPALAAPETPPLTRMTVEVAAVPALGEPNAPFPQCVVMVDDRQGLAAHVAQELNSLAIPFVVLSDDLTNADAVAQAAAAIRAQYPPVTHILHLGALAVTNETPLLEGSKHAVLPLLNLAREFSKELRAAGSNGNAGIVAVTRLGGSLGFEGPAEFAPAQGAVAGFLKTVPREWPGVLSRTVDFPPSTDLRAVARTAVRELLTPDGYTEIGYCDGQRRTLRSTKTPVTFQPSGLELEPGSVVLVTGGARGITAEIAMELAQAFQPRFILCGRSPLPPEQEPADIAGLPDKQLKNAIIDRMTTIGQRPTPALVEGEVKRIKRDREIRSNIAGLKAAGSKVEYYAVDVSDEASFAAMLDHVYDTFGAIHGVVHGAGVIEDKLIEDKTPESFVRVLDPKVRGAYLLAQKLRPESLRFLTFFSSVSARYGNRGQCDYASANEVLNKLASWLNARWPARVVSFDWGPWKTEGGMVSDALAAHFTRSGVELITPPAGRVAFLQELKYGRKDQFEVVFGGPLSPEHQNPSLKAAAERGASSAQPLLPNGFARTSESHAELVLETSASREIFLMDHVVDGKPVWPMAMAMELMAEAAAAFAAQPVARLRDVRLFKGISFADAVTPVRIQVRAERQASGSVQVSLGSVDMPGLVHYRAHVELGQPAPVTAPRLVLRNPRPLGMTVADAYASWLFHGPMFAGIAEIEALGENGITGWINASNPARLFAPPRSGAWQIDPVVYDSALQMIILWARTYLDQTPLPSPLAAYHRFGPLTGRIRCEVEVLYTGGVPSFANQLRLFNEQGQLLGWGESQQVTASKALNRLAKSPSPLTAGAV